MDLKLFEGTLINKEVKLGLDKQRRILVFQSGEKFLRPRDSKKELVTIPESIEIEKIKKGNSELREVIKEYSTSAKLIGTTFNAFLNAYCIQEISSAEQILEKLDEEGKIFFKKVLEIINDPIFLKNGSCSEDYFKEAKVISRFAIMDFELILETLLSNIKGVLFRNEKPVSIFPLRYSSKVVKEEDLEKMVDIFQKKIAQWLNWRKILLEEKLLYDYIIHWLYRMTEALYPEDQEEIKEIIDDINQAELFKNIDMIATLNNKKNYEAQDLASISLNKHLLHYLTMEYLMAEKDILIKDYDNLPTFGFQNIFIAIANTYTSLPIFTAMNPPSNFVGSGLYEWTLKNLNFEAIRGNAQTDPYNLMPNILTLFLSIIAYKSKSIIDTKYIAAKVLVKLFTKDNTKEALKWVKQTEAAMQGKQLDSADIEESEVEDAVKDLNEILEAYTNQLEELSEDRKAELDEILASFAFIDKNYEEIKEEKEKLLKVNKKLIEELNETQKDFLLSVQLVEQDQETLDALAKLFNLLNKYRVKGFPNDIHGFLLLLWLGAITEKGSIKWLYQDTEHLSDEKEAQLLSSICIKYNTAILGFQIKEYPLIESTAPTLILQAAQNLKELLIAKDLAEEDKANIYYSLLARLAKIYG
ncbi:MAG: hypothetical protein ACTSQE_11720 [Candidatus Heimdallarchaeaceae archaeon]